MQILYGLPVLCPNLNLVLVSVFWSMLFEYHKELKETLLNEAYTTCIPSSISIGAALSPSPMTNLAICLILMMYLSVHQHPSVPKGGSWLLLHWQLIGLLV
jgi:hypothetical protein